jgi:putative ABC transport system permease protein
MVLILGSLQLGFIYGLLALGVYLSFRVMNIPDLTAEGSFTLGLAVSAMQCLAGRPLAGLLLGIAAGMLAGCVTGLLQTRLCIHPVLAGILTMSGLYSINLFVLGAAPNVSLLNGTTLYRQLGAALPALGKDGVKLLLSALLAAAFTALLIVFFKTRIGLFVRATGNNEAMVRASSINADGMKVLALAVSNGCIAASGAVLAQYQGSADISSGVGILVVGLASVIIGELFGGRRSVTAGLVCSVAGAIVYRFILAAAIKTNLFPAYLFKLVSAVIVGLALSLPVLREALARRTQKEEA